jgi:anti-anti-sigma factor
MTLSTEIIANPPSTCGKALRIEDTRSADSSVVYSPSTDLDLEGSIRFRHAITGILKPGLDVVLDLSNVQRIEAVGASAVVRSIRRVKALGGSVRICNANPRVAWYLKLVGTDRLTMGNPVPHRKSRTSTVGSDRGGASLHEGPA